MGLGHHILILTIYALAIARLTRLINQDKIAAPLRDRIERRVTFWASVAERSTDRDTAAAAQTRYRRWDMAAYFVGCPWCVGFWLSLGTAIVPVLLIGWPWWTLIGVALATSHLIGVTARFTLDDDEDIEIQTAAAP